ncbi:LysR family transcriptional regulator [Levilactobacillus zymae]|uniref:LysR family transcriptional regulator n=1 Tax=Levilactobacillus zymae TaxID=267363 RepID=UPI0028B73E47|nr:LysR family transcriptional regulator [Levilactobacillus zymae]MDT6979499.1 LysR family transcriptional regulator [Levilactobacillus zymae]
MDTRKLAVFVDLAETLNYSQSAERLFLSQSTISKDILALEQEWRVKLVVRAHRQIHLTRAGRLILPQVKRVLQRETELTQAIEQRFWQRERPLVIQGLSSLPQYRAFQILTRFTRHYPEVQLTFKEASQDHLAHALDQKNVDIVFTRLLTPPPTTYQTLVSDRDQAVVLMTKDHPLAQQAAVTPAMLRGEPLLLQRDTISPTHPLYAVLQELGTQPQLTYDGQRPELFLTLLNQGAGIAVGMSQAFDYAAYPNICAVPLRPQITSQLAFLKQADNSAAVAQLFWRFATQELREEPQPE